MSSESDRDPGIERALRREGAAWRGGTPPSGSTCVDPETLAAWTDGALLPAKAAEVEAHVADCARCQEMVATFALTEPVAAATSLATAPSRSPWLQRWWLPLAGGALAATLLIVTLARRENAAPAALDTQLAMSDAPAAPPPLPVVVAPPTPPQAAAIPPPATAPPPPPATAPPPPPATAPPPPPQVAAAPPPQAAPPPPAAERLQLRADRAAAATGKDLSVAATAPISEFASLVDVAETSPARPAAGAGGAGSGVGGGVVSGATAGRGGGGGRGGASMNIAVQSSVTRWRVMTPTRVQRSIDNGITWVTVSLGDDPVAITSGAAPSRVACWLIGRAGVVLRSLDGTTFTRVNFPETLDLVAITATDALHVTITAAGGRQFTTADGGQTWREQ